MWIVDSIRNWSKILAFLIDLYLKNKGVHEKAAILFIQNDIRDSELWIPIHALMPINAFKKVQTTGKTTGDGFQSGFNKDLYQGSFISTRVDGIAPATILTDAQTTGLLRIGINICNLNNLIWVS